MARDLSGRLSSPARATADRRFPSFGSVSDREALAVMDRLSQFVDHRDGVVLDRDAAFPRGVPDQLVFPDPELAGPFARDELRCRGKEHPVQFGLGLEHRFVNFGQRLDSRQQTLRDTAAVEQPRVGPDVQAAGSSDDQQPFDAGQLDCLDDARIDAQRLLVNVGIVPARIVGADYRVVVADGFSQGCRVGCVGRPRFEIQAPQRDAFRSTHDSRHLQVPVQRFLQNGRADESARADQGDCFHISFD